MPLSWMDSNRCHVRYLTILASAAGKAIEELSLLLRQSFSFRENVKNQRSVFCGGREGECFVTRWRLLTPTAAFGVEFLL